MSDVQKVLDEAGLTNPQVREYVEFWAAHTGAERVEVVSAADDARLIAEALEAGELLPAGEGQYYSRSYYKDTARTEERTIVATSRAMPPTDLIVMSVVMVQKSLVYVPAWTAMTSPSAEAATAAAMVPNVCPAPTVRVAMRSPLAAGPRGPG